VVGAVLDAETDGGGTVNAPDRDDWSVAVDRLEEHQARMHAYFTGGQFAEDAFAFVKAHAERLLGGEPATVIRLSDYRKEQT
jgi:hypothetical protein